MVLSRHTQPSFREGGSVVSEDGLDATETRQILAPIKGGEPHSDECGVYASVLVAATQLVGGETAEFLMLGPHDWRQGAEPAELIGPRSAVGRFIEFCLQQALDLLSEHLRLIRSL